MAVYGIARSGVHQGEMTVCRAKDSSTCPYHSKGSHQSMTEREAQAFNEHVIAESCHKTGGMMSHKNTMPRHATNHGRLGLRNRLLSVKGRFTERHGASGAWLSHARKQVASILILTSIMGTAACGNGGYSEPAQDTGGYSSQVEEPGRTGNDNALDLEKPKQDIQDYYDQAKDTWQNSKAKQKLDELKSTEEYKQGKQKLKDTVNGITEYVGSGNASTDMQNLMDSLSTYGIGGSFGDVNAGAVTGVYADVDKGTALNQLASLRIEKGDENGYDRSQWKHWISTMDAPGGSGLGRKACFNVREQVLARQGQDVTLTDDGCDVTAVLNDPYSGTSGHSQLDMQIDHSVPLGYAYAHGGRNWSSQRKEAYANDLAQGHLVAALGAENISKSDKGPSQWMPDRDQCGYAKNFVNVLYKWDLSTTKADHDIMATVIRSCTV